MPYGDDPTGKLGKKKLVVDPLTGEEIDEDELFYRDQLRMAVVTGELSASLDDDGEWNVGLPDEGLIKAPGEGLKKSLPAEDTSSRIKPPSLPGAGLKQELKPPPTEGDPAGLIEKPPEPTGANTVQFKPPTPEMFKPEGAAAIDLQQPLPPEREAEMRRLRLEATGEQDPVVQDRIFDALSSLPHDAQQEMLAYYRHARAAPSEITPPGGTPNPEQFLEKGLGLNREEAWEYMLNIGQEQLTGNVSQPVWEAFLDKAALNVIDPITFTGKAVLGEEKYESLPGPIKTAAQWAPILVAPQKGLIKDLTIGGMGTRAGTFAIGGAVVGEQVAVATGLDEGITGTALEFAGGLVSPVLLARRWTAVEQALRNAQANADEGIDDIMASEFNAVYDGVKNAKPEDLVTVYHGTSIEHAMNIEREGFRPGSYVTTDAEAAQRYARTTSILEGSQPKVVELKAPREALEAQTENITPGAYKTTATLYTDPEIAQMAALRDGISNPELIAYQVPRKSLAPNGLGFRARTLLTPTANSAITGTIENAAQVVRNFLRAGETGSMRVPFGQELIPDDVARVAFGAGEELDDIGSIQLRKRAISREQESLLDAQGMIPPENAQAYARLADEAVDLGLKMEGLEHAGVLTSSDTTLEHLGDLYRGMSNISDRDLTDRYRSLLDTADKLDPLYKNGSLSPLETETYFLVMQDVAWFGEEVFRRTDGKAGIMPRIKRAFDQFLAAEEGAIRTPNITLPGSQVPERVVVPHPSTNVVSHFGLKPVVPHLTKAERVFNVVKAGLNTNIFGALADPLGTRIAIARRGADTLNESLANRATARIEYLVERAFDRNGFKIDKKTQRIKGIPGEPTLQDLAAAWPQWRPILTDAQNEALRVIREEMEPYYRDLIEQGVELNTRADIVEGGFYIPRGRADKLAEDGVTILYDEPKVGPGGRGSKMSAEKPAVFESMVEGVEAGYQYYSHGEVLHAYFKDAGRRALDAYYANVLKNAVDEGGTPLAQTPHARLMADPKNKALVERMNRLKGYVASLSRSVDGLDDRLHGIWAEFAATPAPDLDKLRYAMRNLFTSGGSIRVRPGATARKLSIQDLREAVSTEVFQNRGKYRGMTGEQARKAALKAALEKQRIRRGTFKGMSFEEGEALLEQIKATIAGIEPQYQAALKKAQQTPRGQMTVAPTGMGANLANHTFDWQLASVINDFLTPTKLPAAVNAALLAPNMLLRGIRATADVSFLGIQGLIGMMYEPTSYRRALGGAFRAMFDPVAGRDILGKYIDDFDRRAVREGLPTSREWASAGIRFGGIDTEFMIGGGIGRLPIIRQANRGFGYFGDLLRLDGANAHFKGRMATATGTAQRQALMKEIAHAQNLMTGWSPQRFGGDAGNVFMFAPRFFDSQMRLVANAVAGKTVTRDMARGMFRNLIGIGTLMTVAVNESLNNDGFDYTSPMTNGRWNPNFMRIRVPGFGDVSIFGPWDSLLKAAQAIIIEGDPGYILRTKASPLVSLVWDTLSGETFVGDKAPRIHKLVQDAIGEIRSALTGTEYESSGDFGLMGDYFLRSFLPFSFAEQTADVVAGKINLSEFAQETVRGSSGVKVSPLSNAEAMDEFRRQTILDLIKDGTIPPEKAELYKNTPFHELLSGERKVVDRAIEERNPEMVEEYRQARRDYDSVYQAIYDQADGARNTMKDSYDKLMEQLLAGEDPRAIMEALGKANSELAGRFAQIYEGGTDKDGNPVASKETKAYLEEILKLPLNDMRRMEFEYNAITTEKFKERGGALRDVDWDAIALAQADFIQKLGEADPALAQRFVDNLELKEKFSIEDAHPIVQLRKLSNEMLTDYYAIPEEDAEARARWLTDNPHADMLRWMAASTDTPILHSVSAAELALKEIPNRGIEVKLASGGTTTIEGVRLANTRQPITAENLPILQKYDKEITQLLNIPTSAVDPRTGREYNPREVLREQDPVYDALYFWLGFSPPNADGTVSVYHPNAVYEYLQQWGNRADKARIKAK